MTKSKSFAKLYEMVTKRLVVLSCLGMAIIVLSQLLARHFWFAELFTHFSVHAVPVLVITAILVKKQIRWVFLFVACVLTIWAVMPLANLFYQHRDDKTAIKIVMANVHINHPNPTKKLNSLMSYQPDVLILLEAGGNWNTPLNKLAKTHPHGCKHQENSPFAMHVFSRMPLKACDVFLVDSLPYIRTELSTQKNTQTIYAVHPPPPINAQLAKIRTQYLQQVAKKIQMDATATLVTGDFNLTPYSPLFRDFLQVANLKQSQHNATGTWFPFLMLPLDHALYKNSAMPYTQTLNFVGSDHKSLMIMVDN